MEALLTHGEGLLVPERMICSPTVAVFPAPIRSFPVMPVSTMIGLFWSTLPLRSCACPIMPAPCL